MIVVTNQSGRRARILYRGRGETFNAHMREVLLAQGARIDAFYYCPHHPEGTVKELAIRCHCRKPQPGMLEQAARDWPIDRGRSFLIGDKDHDIAAAKAFGIRGVKFDAKAGTTGGSGAQDNSCRAAASTLARVWCPWPDSNQHDVSTT